jgi:hypothetical protein
MLTPRSPAGVGVYELSSGEPVRIEETASRFRTLRIAWRTRLAGQ